MHYLVIGSHSPEICPTANAQAKELTLKAVREFPAGAERHNVKMVCGPWVNREHTIVRVAAAERSENLDPFVAESGMAQWNKIHILPSLALLEDGRKNVPASGPIF